MGLLDPTDGLLTFALASGAVGASSNLTGQLITNAMKAPCAQGTINKGAVIGAGIGSFLGGGVGGLATAGLASYGASEGIAAYGGAMGMGPSIAGSSIGEVLGR